MVKGVADFFLILVEYLVWWIIEDKKRTIFRPSLPWSAWLFFVSLEEIIKRDLFELISVDFHKVFRETGLNCNLKLVEDRRKFH